MKIDKLEYAGTYWFEGTTDACIYWLCKKKDNFKLSKEVNSAEWVSLEAAPSRMFPDRSGNTQHILYRKLKEAIGN